MRLAVTRMKRLTPASQPATFLSVGVLLSGLSLLAVGAFGLTTALNYAWSGLVDWPVAGEYIAGGILGGQFGLRAAVHLARQKHTLNRVFAGVILVVAGYMLWRA